MSRPLTVLTDEELWALFPIILEEHDVRWVDDFAREAGALRAIGGVVRAIHVGSTAVPGLVAKPTVDVILELDGAVWPMPDGEVRCPAELVAAMERAGYIFTPQPRDPAPHATFLKGYTPEGFRPPVFHVHVRYAGEHDEVRFRDYLRAHPDAAAEYGRLKRALAERFRHDRDAYTAAKTDFVRLVLDACNSDRDARGD